MDEKTDKEYSSEFKNAVYCILDNFKAGKMTYYEAEEAIEKYCNYEFGTESAKRETYIKTRRMRVKPEALWTKEQKEKHMEIATRELIKESIDEIAKEHSDGSTASYYDLPNLDGIERPQLIHLITYKNMNAQIGTIFEACYRYGQVAHSEKLRDAKKMKFYIDAEIERLEKYGDV